MSGDRIKSAQLALLVFLKSLPPGCYFNIVGFGSTFALLFPEYVLLCNLPGSLEYCSFQFTKVLYIPVAVANSDFGDQNLNYKT